MATEAKPELNSSMDSAELSRWYWTGSELADLARELGVARSGSKMELIERIAAKLSGDPLPPLPERPSRVNSINEPLSEETLVPRGQSCTQAIRYFLKNKIGKNFRFDASMRDFFHQSDGTRTLGDAISHWYSTRDRDVEPIGDQFELNRFTRSWYRDNPMDSREELLRAWETYKATPVELRGRA